LLYLPIYSVTKIDGIKPEDHVVEVSELEHISVSGLPDVVPLGHTGIKVKIIVRALLKVQITVTREEIVSLPEDTKPKGARLSLDRPQRSIETSAKRRTPHQVAGGENWNRYWGHMHRQRATKT